MPQVEGEKVKGEGVMVRGFEVNGLLVEVGETSQSEPGGETPSSPQKQTTAIFASGATTTTTKVLIFEMFISLTQYSGDQWPNNQISAS